MATQAEIINRKLDQVLDVSQDIQNSTRRIESNIASIQQGMDRIEKRMDQLEDRLDSEYNDIRKRFFTTHRQMRNMDEKIDEVSTDLKAIKGYLKASDIQISATGSDFAGALRLKGEKGDINRYGETEFRVNDPESILSLDDYQEMVLERVQSQPSAQILLDQAKNNALSDNDIAHIDFAHERNLLAQEAENRMLRQMRHEIEQQVSRSGSALSDGEVLKIHDRMVEEFHIDWGDGAEKMAHNALIKLEKSGREFMNHSAESIQQDIESLHEELRSESRQVSLDEGGLLGRMKNALSPSQDDDSSGIKSKLKMNNFAYAIKSTLTELSENALSSAGMEWAVSDLKEQAEKMSDHHNMFSKLGEFIKERSEDPFHQSPFSVDRVIINNDRVGEYTPKGDLAIEALQNSPSTSIKSLIHTQWDPENDQCKQIMQSAFSQACELLNPEYYGDCFVGEVDAEDQKKAQQVMSVLVAMDYKPAVDYTNGDLNMSSPVYQQSLERLIHNGAVQALLDNKVEAQNDYRHDAGIQAMTMNYG